MNTLIAFNPFETQHMAARKRAKKLCLQLNSFSSDQMKARKPIYDALFGARGHIFIETGFQCDYGYNIFIGENFYANHHCIMLDATEIHIGNNVLLGPNVHLYTTTHPLDAAERASGMQLIAPITLEDNCWIGGNSVIMPGVTIGARSVIGAGSVVTRSIPADTIAVGNPCRPVNRQSTPAVPHSPLID
jgi:maltose O-acetyltransferase